MGQVQCRLWFEQKVTSPGPEERGAQYLDLGLSAEAPDGGAEWEGGFCDGDSSERS